MSTLAIVLIAIGVVIVVGLVVSALSRRRIRTLEDRRQVANEHRNEAASRELDAEMHSAAADEQAARSRREAAQAEARSRAAQSEQEKARAHSEHAERIDPDA